MCLRADIMPTSRRRLNSRQCSDPVPPITSTNSCVSLKGDCSKPVERSEIELEVMYSMKYSADYSPKFFGDMLRMKPKSMWIM